MLLRPELGTLRIVSGLYIHGGLVLPEDELSWSASRSGGPGGQRVNKVATKVELRFDLPGSLALSHAAKARLAATAAHHLDAEGRLVVTSQLTRSQSRNLEDARERLAHLVREGLRPEKRRVATRPTRGSERRRLEQKRRLSDKKKARKSPVERD